MTTTPCTGCAVQHGTHQPAEAVHQISEPKTQQREALRLADELGMWHCPPSHILDKAAAELRRQHARIVELEAQLAEVNHPTQQGLDAPIIQALAAGISIQQWQSSVEILIGSSDLLVRAIASGKETRIELIRRAVSEAIASQAKHGAQA